MNLFVADDPIYLEESAPFYPSSPMELLLMTILCFISVCVMAYAMVVLYHCVCSRNYAEWRASWNENVTQMLSTQVINKYICKIYVFNNNFQNYTFS